MKRTTLRQQLTRLMALAALLGLGLAALALTLVTGYSGREAAARDLATLAKVLADNSTAALSFGDEHSAARTLAAVQAKPDITLVCLFASVQPAAGSKAFAAWPPQRGSECAGSLQASPVGLSALQMRTAQPVVIDGEPIGLITLTQNMRQFRSQLFGQVALALLVVALAFLLTFAYALRAQGAMVAPLLELAALARKVSLTADYGLRARLHSHNEVGQLAEDFNGMLGKIKHSDDELRATRDALAGEVGQKTLANKELEHTLKRLTDAQTQLVQSEKMASLGALVAGVAHEINTPVGVSVTAASTLAAKSVMLRRLHSESSMKRSDLEAFVNMADECTRILLSNLQRAAELIQSFKQVAVDQTSDERRRFALGPYLSEVLLSLGPKLKRVEVKLACADDIWVDSYPGALAQVLTNFITNSLLHGFDDGRQGQIAITVATGNGQVQLSYVDNGKGVDAEHLPRIFDPFFTTKRGAGGSGLGMHIVFNLISQRLGGQIAADSAPGQGLTLRLSFPLVAPRAGGMPA